MSRIRADKYGHGEPAHPRVSASSAVGFVLLAVEARTTFAGSSVVSAVQKTHSLCSSSVYISGGLCSFVPMENG